MEGDTDRDGTPRSQRLERALSRGSFGATAQTGSLMPRTTPTSRRGSLGKNSASLCRGRQTGGSDGERKHGAPNIAKSALIIVDMQNDFVHADGGFAHAARAHPEANIDLPFPMGTIPNVKRLADPFRLRGARSYTSLQDQARGDNPPQERSPAGQALCRA
jgi:hypothetical protein